MQLKYFKKNFLNRIILALFALFVVDCHYPTKGDNNMLTQDEAIGIAKKEFAKHGRVPADYSVTIETYHADDNQWIVWFEKIGPFPIPGGKEAVLVDKQAGQSIFLPGE